MAQPSAENTKSLRLALSLGALGVVFGDIGTSPLYAMRECIRYLPEGDRTGGVLGILSLVFWSLTMVVGLKYLTFITRADNRGEGGIFALLALLFRKNRGITRLSVGVLVVLVGAALLYGDGVITPAISVLAAAEGLTTIAPGIKPLVPWIACGILAGLFWFQHKGTRSLGRVFGPVILVWFLVIGAIGAWHVFKNPEVLRALNPWYGYQLLRSLGDYGHVAHILGGVVLAVTGAEALYADMGHFGRKAIVRAWYFVVLPGLVLNYFGQGAHALVNPASHSDPFFSLAPDGMLRGLLVALSIAATIIASQALISGTFSLTRQAIQLGFFPRLTILHTNAEMEGQIYMPLVNRLLAIGAIATVLGFRSSDSLAAAYGLVVTGTMVVTTYAFFAVAFRLWRWSWLWIVPLAAIFLTIDLVFLGANLHKIGDGGWLPLVIATVILLVMHTWKRGREVIFENVYGRGIEDVEVGSLLGEAHVHRVGGTAVFMAASSRGTPLALLHHLKANRCVQKSVVLLTIIAEQEPHVADAERLDLQELGCGVWRAVGRYGYMESPDVEALVRRIRERGVKIDPMSTTYYFNREMILTGGKTGLMNWQKEFYAFLSRNARSAKDYYQIPPQQIIEIGLPIQL